MSKTPTQNDWKKEFQGWAFDHDRRYFKSAEGKRLMSLISRLLANARKEVIDDIFKMRITDLPNGIRFVTKDAPDGDLVDGTTWNAILESIMMALRKEIK